MKGSTEDALTAPREYLRVRPTTDAIHPEQVAQALRKLHGLSADDDGWLTAETPPTVEMLLLAPAASQRVDYLFGIDDGRREALARVLDVWFPNSYEVTEYTTSLDAALTAADSSVRDRPVAGLDYHAEEDRPGDWRTRLTPFEAFQQTDAADAATWPLASVLTALAETDVPVVVQTLLRPKPDWSSERDARITALREHRGGTPIDALWDALEASRPQERATPEYDELPPDVQSRIDELEAVDPRRSLAINVRAVAFGTPETATDPAVALAELNDAFAAVGHTGYQLSSTRYGTDSDAAASVCADVATRRFRETMRTSRLPTALPVVGPHAHTTRPRIVADPTTAGSFCAVGGGSLPEPARRALRTKPRDDVPRPLPPEDLLDRYRGPGFDLGPPVTTDETPAGESLAVPPAHQRRHLAIVGQTGTGKGMFIIPGLLRNHEATDGATVIFEPKDGTFADDYTRAHYAEYGSLEDVYRFDAHEYLPAAPVFDIEPAMASGLSRTQAVAAITNRLEAMLEGVMGAEAYAEATTSSRVIRAVTKSLFDPVHGSTQCTLVDIQETLARLKRTGSAPPVSDDRLRRTLADIVDSSRDTFTEIVDAATRRLDELATHDQLAPQFTYAPGGTAADVERFDWRAKLDEDCVVIVDTSALEREPQRVLTLLTLSQLWTALRRRRREQRDAGRDGLPLVNVHVEEAADVATSGALDGMLRQGRSYGVAVSLSMQFLGQLEAVDQQAYREAINNTGTIIAGQTNRDHALAERLATTELSREEVAARLRALDPGEWLCSLAGSFDGETPPPFTIRSGPLPPGHPDGPRPLSEAQTVTYRAGVAKLRARTRAYGLAVDGDAGDMATEPDTEEAAATTDASAPDPNAGRRTLDTTGPLTAVTPDGITFDAAANDWVCRECGKGYGYAFERLLEALDCHVGREAADRERVPTVAVDCSLPLEERQREPYDDHQFAFMQLLYNVWRGRYDPEWEFDLVWDEMDRLRAYAGLDDAGLTELVTDGLVVKDTTEPHPIYSLTAAGRQLLDVAHRDAIAYGDDHGDLSESNFHRMLVETMARGFRRQFVDDPDHPGAEVRRYYGVTDGRLDVAVLDADGQVVIAGEAERSNNDMLTAVPSDFDKMAACEPDRAIWVVPNRDTGMELIRALNSPADGRPRVGKTYADEYLPRVQIDEPGFTDIYSIGVFRDRYLDGFPW